MKNGWYWIDTGWACGGIYSEFNIVKIYPPVFRKFKGVSIEKLAKHYKLIFILL